MITEQELAKLAYAEVPKIISDHVPGPRGQKYLDDSHKYESMARGGGGFPLVFDEGMGATVKDPDGNVFRFMPPLVLTEAHAQKATEILLDVAKNI